MFSKNLLKIKFPLSSIKTCSRLVQTNAVDSSKRKNVAMILSGCGVYDGSEIIEASSCAIHLTRHNANVHFFAPNIDQMHVINHFNGEVQVENRNVLNEAARIARGNIKPLDKLKGSEFDALVIPGGFGAAKNLSNYATRDTAMTVNKDVERVIQEFLSGKKPIGLCCIAPVLAAKVIGGCEVTVGMENNSSGQWPFADTTKSIIQLGAKHVSKDVNEFHVDKRLLVVTTPAFMKHAEFYQVYDGIGKMIEEVLKLCN